MSDATAPSGLNENDGHNENDGQPVYRELSTAAVASVVAGLCSPLLLLSGLLILIPLLALVLGLSARRWVRAYPQARSGAGLALVGVGLAVASLSAAGVQARLTPWLLSQQARPVAEAWLERVRSGDPEAAVGLTRRPPVGPDEEPPTTLVQMIPHAAELIEMTGWSGEQYAGVVSHASQPRGGWVVQQRYRLISKSGPPSELIVQLRRERYADGIDRWLVSGVADPDSVAGR